MTRLAKKVRAPKARACPFCHAPQRARQRVDAGTGDFLGWAVVHDPSNGLCPVGTIMTSLARWNGTAFKRPKRTKKGARR